MSSSLSEGTGNAHSREAARAGPSGFRSNFRARELAICADTRLETDAPMQLPQKSLVIRTANVIDTPLSITNYRKLVRLCLSRETLPERGNVTICFADLNVLFLRKKDEAFARLTDESVDLFIPDGVSLRLLLAKKGIPL